ncbi:MAG: hypothetical protein HWE27_05210 [Gammaproteobacteria bacterium]|nr:hypothetical protein [Gammaproteobacteria bacterium]
MAVNDWDYVNFSQDHEMNYHLGKVSKRQTEANRRTLRVMGTELKTSLNAVLVTHTQFHAYVSQLLNLMRLE